MRLQISSRRRTAQAGNVMVEFALMSTLLILTTVGVVDFGRIFHQADIISNAAAAGTRYGALSPVHYSDTAGMEAAARADAGNITGLTATATRFCACGIGGQEVPCPAICNTGDPETYVRVTVTAPFNLFMSVPGIPPVTTLSGKAVARVQ